MNYHKKYYLIQSKRRHIMEAKATAKPTPEVITLIVF